MYCKNCGKEIPDGSKFCPECGTDQTVSEPKQEESSKVVMKPIISDTKENTSENKEKNPKKKASAVGIVALIFSLFGGIGFIGSIIGFIEIIVNRKKTNRHGLSFAAIIIGILMTIVFNSPSTGSNKTTAAKTFDSTSAVSVESVVSSSQYSTAADSESTKEPKKETVTDASTESTSKEMSEDDFKKSCKEFSYKKYARNPEKYEGTPVKVKVQIFQAIDGNIFDGYDRYFQVYTDDGSGVYFKDMIYVMDGRDENSPEYIKLLEDDIITVYGTFTGNVKSTNMITFNSGEDIAIEAKYITLNSSKE